MHDAYRKPLPLAYRLAAAALLLPGAAWAMGVPVGADGVAEPPSAFGQGLPVFLSVLFVLLCVFALSWLVHAAWKLAFKTEPPFGLFSVIAMWGAILLALIGFFVVPSFQVLFASFGSDLPPLTLFVSEYHYLLLAPAILLPGVLYIFRRHARRERYFAAILTGEFLLLLLCAGALYLPVFPMGEAV